jgi:hypothetical protein
MQVYRVKGNTKPIMQNVESHEKMRARDPTFIHFKFNRLVRATLAIFYFPNG